MKQNLLKLVFVAFVLLLSTNFSNAQDYQFSDEIEASVTPDYASMNVGELMTFEISANRPILDLQVQDGSDLSCIIQYGFQITRSGYNANMTIKALRFGSIAISICVICASGFAAGLAAYTVCTMVVDIVEIFTTQNSLLNNMSPMVCLDPRCIGLNYVEA